MQGPEQKDDWDVRQVLAGVVPDPSPHADLYREVLRRARRTTRVRFVIAFVLLAGAVIGVGVPLQGLLTSRESEQSSTGAVGTCGKLPHSDGPLANRVAVTMSGPRAAESGSRLAVQVAIAATEPGSVRMNTTSRIDLLIVSGGAVVGRTGLPFAGTGEIVVVNRTAPVVRSASVILSGCPTGTGDAAAEVARVPLPPGTYTLVAVLEDDSFGEADPRMLVSAPLMVEVMAVHNQSATVTKVLPYPSPQLTSGPSVPTAQG